MLKWQYPHDSALEHWAALLQSSGIDDSNLRNDGPADTDMLRDKRIAKRLGSVLAWPSRLARPGLRDAAAADLSAANRGITRTAWPATRQRCIGVTNVW